MANEGKRAGVIKRKMKGKNFSTIKSDVLTITSKLRYTLKQLFKYNCVIRSFLGRKKRGKENATKRRLHEKDRKNAQRNLHSAV